MSRIPLGGSRSPWRAAMTIKMDKKGGLRLKSLFCWRYLGLTGIERLAYDVAVSVGLTTKPEAS